MKTLEVPTSMGDLCCPMIFSDCYLRGRKVIFLQALIFLPMINTKFLEGKFWILRLKKWSFPPCPSRILQMWWDLIRLVIPFERIRDCLFISLTMCGLFVAELDQELQFFSKCSQIAIFLANRKWFFSLQDLESMCICIRIGLFLISSPGCSDIW